MAEAAEQDIEPPKGKFAKLKIPLAAIIVGGGAFAASFLGYVRPSELMASEKPAEHSEPGVHFIDVPRFMVPLSGGHGQLVMTVMLETTADHAGEVAQYMPRLQDSFMSFLSQVDQGALDQRGVLEILRSELLVRAQLALGDGAVEKLLITEFAVQ